MSWVIAILLALAAFALGAFAFRLPRATWTILLAAMALGLTGYALQANPGLAGAPRDTSADVTQDEWGVVEARRELVTGRFKSGANGVLTADAFAQRGQFENAAGFLSGVVRDNPRDFEAWVALGNALTEQADGVLTQASVYAFSQAAELSPSHPAPAYFLGLSLIRQGRMMEARSVWRDAVQRADGAEEGAYVAARLERLDQMLQQAGALPPADATGNDTGQ